MADAIKSRHAAAGGTRAKLPPERLGIDSKSAQQVDRQAGQEALRDPGFLDLGIR
jgi:hypothetical protein